MRAAQVVPAFRNALVVHLIEISPALRRRQEETLKGIDVPMLWHDSFDEVPDGPAIVLANEFFDALPVYQAVKQINGWYERMVGIDQHGNFAFSIADEPMPLFEQLLPPAVRDAPLGSLFEWRADNLALELGRRIMRQGGAALVDRLRPRRERGRRNLAGGRPARLRRSAGRARARSTSPRTSTSRRWGSPPRAWACARTARSTRPNSCAAWASSAAPPR